MIVVSHPFFRSPFTFSSLGRLFISIYTRCSSCCFSALELLGPNYTFIYSSSQVKRRTKKTLCSQRISLFVYSLLLCITITFATHNPHDVHHCKHPTYPPTTTTTRSSSFPSCIYPPPPTGWPIHTTAPQTLHFTIVLLTYVIHICILVVCINIPAAHLQDNRFFSGLEKQTQSAQLESSMIDL